MQLNGYDLKQDNRKITRLLYSVGPDAERKYDAFAEGKETYEQAIKIFERLYSDQSSLIMKRIAFKNRKQRYNKSFLVYFTELKQLIKECEFGQLEADLLRDQIVDGIYDQQFQRKLLETEDLTLKKLLNLVMVKEMTETRVTARSENSNTKERWTTAARNIHLKKCFRCGSA